MKKVFFIFFIAAALLMGGCVSSSGYVKQTTRYENGSVSTSCTATTDLAHLCAQQREEELLKKDK